METRIGAVAWAFLCIPLLWGCGDEHKHDDTGDGHDPHGELECDDGNGLDEYVAGISRTTTEGSYEVAILDADPAPPDVDLNAWELSVTHTDADATSFTEGTVRVRPWMPLHGHGTSPERYNAEHVEDDVWQVDGVNLVMPGLWEIHVEVTDTDGEMEELMFRFCAQG